MNISYSEALERLEKAAQIHQAHLEQFRQPLGSEVGDESLRPSSSCNSSRNGCERSFRGNSVASGLGVNSSAIQDACSQSTSLKHSLIPLRQAVGLPSSKTLKAPHSFPRHDISMTNGFALCSRLTRDASELNPIFFQVVGTMAKQIPVDVEDDDFDEVEFGITVGERSGVTFYPSCVDITAGARFPTHNYPEIDAVVRYAEVRRVTSLERRESIQKHETSLIAITKPVMLEQNRRLTGCDITKDSLLIQRGECFKARHVTVLTSLGFTEVQVMKDMMKYNYFRTIDDHEHRLRIGILAIGSELAEPLDKLTSLRSFASTSIENNTSKSRTLNSNCSYLMASLRATKLDIATTNLRCVSDNLHKIPEKLQQLLYQKRHDIIIATGGSSIDPYDFAKHISGSDSHINVIFHSVNVNPDLSVMIATVDSETTEPESRSKENHSLLSKNSSLRKKSIIFRLPGDPFKTAAGFHFFVLPYLNFLQQDYNLLKQATLSISSLLDSMPKTKVIFDTHESHHITIEQTCDTISLTSHARSSLSKPKHLTVFWLGKRRTVSIPQPRQRMASWQADEFETPTDLDSPSSASTSRSSTFSRSQHLTSSPSSSRLSYFSSSAPRHSDGVQREQDIEREERETGTVDLVEILDPHPHLHEYPRYQISSLLQTNCWVLVPAGISKVNQGDELVCVDFV